MIDKQDFEEYVGRDKDEVLAKVKEKFSGTMTTIYDVSNDMAVTMDYRLDRIRVWYDSVTNKVTDVING